jgi:hypothetical protein
MLQRATVLQQVIRTLEAEADTGRASAKALQTRALVMERNKHVVWVSPTTWSKPPERDMLPETSLSMEFIHGIRWHQTFPKVSRPPRAHPHTRMRISLIVPGVVQRAWRHRLLHRGSLRRVQA